MEEPRCQSRAAEMKVVSWSILTAERKQRCKQATISSPLDTTASLRLREGARTVVYYNISAEKLWIMGPRSKQVIVYPVLSHPRQWHLCKRNSIIPRLDNVSPTRSASHRHSHHGRFWHGPSQLCLGIPPSGRYSASSFLGISTSSLFPLGQISPLLDPCSTAKSEEALKWRYFASLRPDQCLAGQIFEQQ